MMNLVLALFAVLPPAWAAAVFLWPPFPKMFGRQSVFPGSLFAAWGAVSAASAFFAPSTLVWTSFAGAALGAFMARGRFAALSAPRPLPPGSMSFARGVRALASRSFYLQGFSVWGPVFKSTQFGAPIICVVGMERICRLMRGHAGQLGPSPLAVTQSIMGNFLRYMDDATHAKYGGLFRRAMAGEAPALVEIRLRARSREVLAGLAAAGPTPPGPALRKFARESLDLLMFGFQGEDDRSREFGRLADCLYSANIGQALARSDRGLMEEMEALLVGHLAQLGREPAQFTPVLGRLRDLDAAMPDRVCLDNLVLMHKIATNNVSSLLQWLLFYWATQPEAVAHIRSLPASGRAKALDAFLSETLRLSQSEYLYRKVVQEFEFEGFRFPRGWMVRSCIWESHRTTEALPAPTEFRLRLGPDDYGRDHFSPFGMGRHACSGVDVNHTICLAFLNEMADVLGVEVEDAEPFQRLMRHWSHWQPNRAMEVRITKPA